MAYESEYDANFTTSAEVDPASSIPVLTNGQSLVVQNPLGQTQSIANATNILVGDTTGDTLDTNASANQFADITNSVKSGGSGIYTDVSDNAGNYLSNTIVYVIVQNSSYPLEDVVLSNFSANDASSTGLVTATIPISLTSPFTPEVGSTGTITTFMGSFDDGDNLNLNYDGGSNLVSNQTSSVLAFQFINANYTVTSASPNLSFHFALQNGANPPTTGAENDSTILVQIPVSPAAVTYSAIDQNENLIASAGGIALSQAVWKNPDGTLIPEVLGSNSQLLLNGLVGQAIPDFGAPVLKGYSFVKEVNDTPSDTFQSAAPSTITYKYTNAAQYTEHFIDSQTGQEFQAPQVVNGTQLSPFTVVPPTLSGYRLNTTKSTNLTGTYQAQNQDIDLYYDKQTNVNIHLVGEDSHGNKTDLETLPVLTGYAGDSYIQALPHIQDYRFPTLPVNGNFTDSDQDITVVYLKEMGGLSINYINQQTGLALLPTLNIDDNIGDKQVIQAPFIAGYTAQNSTGTDRLFTQLLPWQTQTVYYAPDHYEATIEYEDANGNVIAPAQNLTGYYGSSAIYKAPVIDGYQLASGQVQNLTIDYSKPQQTIVIKYTPAQGSMHFTFVDENGKQVPVPETISGDDGSDYHFVPPYIKYLKVQNSNDSIIAGKFTNQKQDYTVKYSHLQSKLQVYGIMDRGVQVSHQTFTGLEGDTKTVKMPNLKNLQLKNSKYQDFSQTLNSQNKVIIILYKHIPSKLTVNLKIDGVTKAHFSVTGFIGDHFSMNVPMIHNAALTGGTSKVTGTYSQVNQTYNVDYHYVHSTIYFRLYDSAGDYITTVATSGKYGQVFSYTLPAYVSDNYGYTYYPKFNRTVTGYFGAQDEGHNVIYQYKGPHGYYEPTAYKVPNQSEGIHISLMDMKTQSVNFNDSVRRLGMTSKQLVTLLDYALPPGISTKGTRVQVGTNWYYEVYSSDSGFTLYYLGPVSQPTTSKPASTPKQPANPPANTKRGSVYVDAARDFWVWDGTTWILTDYSSLPPMFSMSWLGKSGLWNFSNGVGVNEKNTFNSKLFWDNLKLWGLRTGIVVQNGVTLASNIIPIVGEGADVGDGAADVPELAIETQLEQTVEEDGVAAAEEANIVSIPVQSIEELPSGAQQAYNEYSSNGWQRIQSGVMGKITRFNNNGDPLPTIDENGNPITYKEYRVIRGDTENTQRFIRAFDSNGNSLDRTYYSDNHYDSFSEVK